MSSRITGRTFDVLASLAGLIVLAPLLMLIATVVRIGRGPVLYRAERVGCGGELFMMHKFRTMQHARSTPDSSITAQNDSRITAIGRVLRTLKLDELPQLWDVLRGKMSIVGPRPEDPGIVEQYYTPMMRETLRVRPGLTSPGSIYGSAHMDLLDGANDPTAAYVEHLLVPKLAIELVYLDRRTFWYDMRVIARTVVAIASLLLRRRPLRDPPEMPAAEQLILLGGFTSRAAGS